MSLFSWLTSAPKVVDNVFDMDKGLLTQVGRWVGGQQFTEQEKAEFGQTMAKGVQSFAVATMGENTERSKARREIAVEWIRLQIWLIKLTVFCIFLDYLIVKLGQDDPELMESVVTVAFSPYLWGITGAVSVFFFGTHSLRSSKWGAKE